MAFAKAPRDRADFKHFRTRTASSRTRVVMPVVLDREVATVLMLGMQFLQLAHAYLESMGAPQPQLPADGFSLQDTILHAQRAKRRRPRGVTRRGRYDDEVDDEGRPFKGMKRFMLDYTKSTYWTDYVNLKDADFYDANPGKHEVRRKNFESRIRMPLRLFQDLVREMEDDPFMQERGDMAIPLRMKLAASLRFLALGCPWVGLEEIFRVSAQTLRTWFQNKFLPWMMKNKYGAYVKYPLTHDELAKAVEPFTRAGFPGMCGLSDGVHVRLYRCFSASVKARFVGSKKVPTVVWNVTVDYEGRPIFVSVAAPGSTNDKGIVQTNDMFLRNVLMKNDVYTGFEYKLARQNGVQKVRGVGVGVDGGYDGRRQFVAGYEHPRFGTWEWTWSKAFESLRKKVECLFGILKRQYNILNVGICDNDMTRVDKVFKVCCALYNMRYEALGRGGASQDWRQVDEEELAEIYGEDGRAWIGEDTEESVNEEDVDVAEPQGGQGEEEEPELGEIETLDQLRIALVRHFKRHKLLLRANRGEPDREEIVREVLTFTQRR
jgi:hypothetical protein